MMNSYVTLHIYDLGTNCREVNMALRVVGSGAYHAGVEVYGKEWCFGPGGICWLQPQSCPHHSYREPINMGKTRMSSRDVDSLIKQLVRAWPGQSYDILTRNCCHFSDELCRRLGMGPIPDWVLSLADTGAEFRSGAQFVMDLAMNPMQAIWSVLQEPSGEPSVGDRIDVFSNTCQVWCNGRIKSINHSDPRRKMVTVSFRTPAAPNEETNKILPLDSKELQRPGERFRRGGC